MLVPTPPRIIPMFALVSSSSRPSCMAAMALAAAWMALRPVSGSTPACAARPRNVALKVSWLGALTVMPPTGPDESKTAANGLASTRSSRCLAPTRPISSETVKSSSYVGKAGSRVHQQLRRVDERGDRRLVVRPQDGAAAVTEHALVIEKRVDIVGRDHRVEMRPQRHVWRAHTGYHAPEIARVSPGLGPGVVFVDGNPHGAPGAG